MKKCPRGERLLSWRAKRAKGAKKGPRGRGASAYELAVKHGFTGSERQWLAALVGPRGPVGATGARGRDGADGADGADGVAGVDGAPGVDGVAGLSAYEIAVGYGYPGDEEDWLLSLIGADGADGADGVAGADGADGLSAYDIAVLYGFAGSEAEWLDSLKGADGADGADGLDGAPGADGAPGTDGLDGLDGAPGADGADGAPGSPGSPGADGRSAYEVAVANGFTGTEPEWLTSLKGADGADGAAGPPGPALESSSMYTRTQSPPVSDYEYRDFTISCDEGDLVMSSLWDATNDPIVFKNYPIDADTWFLQVYGSFAEDDVIGISCLDLTS